MKFDRVPGESFGKELNPTQSEFELIKTEFSIRIILASDSFRLDLNKSD